MADAKPTMYYIDPSEENGMRLSEIYCALWNLYKAVYEICNHLDVDNGTLGTDFVNDIGASLKTAMENGMGTPHTSRKTVVAT